VCVCVFVSNALCWQDYRIGFPLQCALSDILQMTGIFTHCLVLVAVTPIHRQYAFAGAVSVVTACGISYCIHEIDKPLNDIVKIHAGDCNLEFSDGKYLS